MIILFCWKSILVRSFYCLPHQATPKIQQSSIWYCGTMGWWNDHPAHQMVGQSFCRLIVSSYYIEDCRISSIWRWINLTCLLLVFRNFTWPLPMSKTKKQYRCSNPTVILLSIWAIEGHSTYNGATTRRVGFTALPHHQCYSPTFLATK